jgi:carboxymethylenebutenolidase
LPAFKLQASGQIKDSMKMCYDSDSRPPHPPVSGGVGNGQRIVLRAADGNEFAAFSAVGKEPQAPGIVILPDVRGLHAFYEEFAMQFSEIGIHATAIDYFGRTAGIGSRGNDFDYEPHIALTTPDTVALDVAAAVDHLRSTVGGEAMAVFTIGFCFGGRASFNQAARENGLAGVVGFYGRVAPRDSSDQAAPVLLAKTYTCPVLGLFGGADPSITSEDVRSFRHALDAAGVRNELVVYEGAPHSFFDRVAGQNKVACDDAWVRVLRFIEANTQGKPSDLTKSSSSLYRSRGEWSRRQADDPTPP